MEPVLQLLDARHVGGIERHVEVLCRALQAAGVPSRPVLLADHGATPARALFERAGLEPLVGDGTFRELLRLLRRTRPSLVHTHGYKAGILGRPAARLAGIGVVSTFHAGERGPFPVGLYQDVDRWTSWLGRRIAVSAPIAKGIPFPTGIVPNFIDLPPADDAVPASRIAAFVGRLSPEKGPDLFCEAAVRSPGSIRWVMFGDGPMRAELEARYGDRVAFRGVTDMATAWGEIGVLAITSRAEGLPMAALEALAHGVPVVAHRVGGLPDLLTPETGDLVDPGDAAGLIRAVAARLDASPEQRLATRHACRALVAERHGAEAGARRILAVYAEANGRAAFGEMRRVPQMQE